MRSWQILRLVDLCISVGNITPYCYCQILSYRQHSTTLQEPIHKYFRFFCFLFLFFSFLSIVSLLSIHLVFCLFSRSVDNQNGVLMLTPRSFLLSCLLFCLAFRFLFYVIRTRPKEDDCKSSRKTDRQKKKAKRNKRNKTDTQAHKHTSGTSVMLRRE